MAISMKDLVEFPELEAFALEHIKITGSSFKGWQHAESLVWELKTDTDCYYLKAHRQSRKFQQEMFAYRNWTAVLGERVPQLIATKDTGQKAMILSGLAGTLVEQKVFEAKQYRQMYQQAGFLLRCFHDQPYIDSDIPLAQALPQRVASWSQRGQGIVSKTDLDWVASLVKHHASLLSSQNRVPCHRDYSPRNWLFDGQRLYLIDFEHAKANLFLSDFVRLTSYHFPGHEAWEEAFWQGYGRSLDDDESRMLDFLTAFEAMTTIVWATEHKDTPFRLMGEKTLERLKTSSDF